MSAKAQILDDLQARLNYRFADPDLFEKALTHSSAVSPGKRTERSYQRLEFLGDRVLGLVVADLLHRQFPKANEGELSRTLNTLVRKETCADVARALDLGVAINLGDSEARSGGAEKEAILADVCEAVIGAVYLDGGLEKAHDLIVHLFGDLVEKANARGADSKTALQEWALARALAPPTYVEKERTGPDHAPEFVIEVSITGFAPEAAGGPSKKIAEHKAAERFLLRENIWKTGL